MKTCYICHESKSLTEFHKLSRSPDGRQSKCKSCAIKIMQDWKAANPEKYREYNDTKSLRMLLSKHGIPWEDWNEISLLHPCCSICGRKSSSLVIDHDHSSGLVRGLLCRDCNLGLGNFKDSIDFLVNASNYLSNPPLLERGYVSGEGDLATTKNGWKASRRPRESKPNPQKAKDSFCACGRPKDPQANQCRACYSADRETIVWPNTVNLIAMVRETSYTEVARKLGVSDNAVRKRIQNHPSLT